VSDGEGLDRSLLRGWFKACGEVLAGSMLLSSVCMGGWCTLWTGRNWRECLVEIRLFPGIAWWRGRRIPDVKLDRAKVDVCLLGSSW